MTFEIRPLSGHSEYKECLRLQYETWGERFDEHAAPSLLKISQMLGGVAAGAFAADGRLAGFVFGLTGLRNRRLAHWSHMLAVRPEIRDQGLGFKLKAYQRKQLLETGVLDVYWTFDPLVARNAHLNLNRLGAIAEEYQEEFYPQSESSLHRGLGTDRFVVHWELTSPQVVAALSGNKQDRKPDPTGPVVNARLGQGGQVQPCQPTLARDPRIRVEVPWDIHTAKEAFPEAGALWRETTRKAFQHYLKQGYRVSGFHKDAADRRCFYEMLRQVPEEDPKP